MSNNLKTTSQATLHFNVNNEALLGVLEIRDNWQNELVKKDN